MAQTLAMAIVLAHLGLGLAQLPINPKLAPPNNLNEALNVLNPKQIGEHLESQRNQLQSVIGVGGNQSLLSLFPVLGQYNLDQMRRCYNPAIEKGKEVNIFSGSIFEAIQAYYENIPENYEPLKFAEKTKNLFQSMTKIAEYVIDCMTRASDYQLGLTVLSDLSDEDYFKMLGERKSPNIVERFLGRRKLLPGRKRNPLGLGLRLRRATHEAEPICILNSTKVDKEFDWRKENKVTKPKYQKSCGSCWAFTSAAILESAYLIHGKTEDLSFDISEQELAGCAKDNGCKGGTAVDAFNYILDNDGVGSEKDEPYNAKNVKCKKSSKKIATIDDFCLRGSYVTLNGKKDELKDEDIMALIRHFGPLYATMDAEDLAMKNMKTGIYNNPDCKKTTNHAVTVIGWNEKSWLIKNSWSEKWGDEGYFHLKRGENMCGLNTYVVFPIVK